MGKQEFLARLRKGLSGLPQEDTEERLTFYREMIEDRMEEGLSEEEAVSAVGTVDEIVAQISAEMPHAKNKQESLPPKRQLKAWEIALLVLGAPLWLSLGIAAVAVVFSFYISLWAVIISLWAVFGSLAGGSLGGIVTGIVLTCGDNTLVGIAMLGAGLVCAGLAFFMFFGCRAATNGILVLTKKPAVWIRNRRMHKEEAQ